MTAAVEIRETVVTPTDGGLVIALHISDAPKNAENATLTIAILANIPQPKTQILEGLQMDALRLVRAEVGRIFDELYAQIPARAQSLLREG